MLKALLLHDFVHTEKHQSKIYHQVDIENVEIRNTCLNHHNGKEKENQLIPIVNYYDRLASYITRKKPYKITARYDFHNGEIDFEKITKEIEALQDSAFKLYLYIYNSKELKRIVESMDYGKNSLRNHLLIMANLAINDYLSGKLKLDNNKFIIERKISTTTSEREEELDTVKDAEMHQSMTMSNANLERTTTSKKRRLGT